MIGAAVAALIATVATFVAMLQFEKNELSKYEKKEVFVVNTIIPKGTVINDSNCSDYMEGIEIDKNVVGENTLCDLEDINNLSAKYDINPGTLLCADMFESIDYILSKMKNPVELSIKTDDLYQIVGGVLRSGDRIAIYYSDEDERLMLGWDDIYVKAVFDSSGKIIESGNRESSAQRINVYFEKEEVCELYSKMTPGNIKIVKVGIK